MNLLARTASVAVGAIVLSISPATAQLFENWDLDGDGVVEISEFSERFPREILERWDEDDDQLIGAREFAVGVRRLWDTDNNGTLTVDEWDEGADAWFGEQDVSLDVSTWDDDGDGTISRAEFIDAWERTNLFGLFAENGQQSITGDEFAEGAFRLADRDEDEVLGEDEDNFLVDLVELFTPEDEEEDDFVEDPDFAEADSSTSATGFSEQESLIERGESFVGLPIPCSEVPSADNACEQIARRFCETLGYGPPIDFLQTNGQLHVVRCEDEI